MGFKNDSSSTRGRGMTIMEIMKISEVGMCNSDRVLGRDSDDWSWKWWSWGKIFWLVIAALWAAHWALIVSHASVQSIWLWSHVMSGLSTYISDSSNIGCVGILTCIYMLNALHITIIFMLKCITRYGLLFETVILLLDVSFSKMFSYWTWIWKQAGDFRNHLIM